MQASPSELGLLTLSRAVVQALVSPVGGFLGTGSLPLLSFLAPVLLKALTT